MQLNAIVKSGGNKLKGDFYYDYENSAWQGHNVTDDLRRLGVGEGQRMLHYRDPNVSIGGPILRDKIVVLHVGPRSADRRHGAGFPVESPSDFEFPDAADEHHLQDQLSALARTTGSATTFSGAGSSSLIAARAARAISTRRSGRTAGRGRPTSSGTAS